MKELIERLRIVVDEHTTISNPWSSPPLQTSVIDQHGLSVKAAIDALERLTAERDPLQEGLDGWHSRYLDAEVERDALKEQMTADRKQFLDMRDERDALAQNAERVRVYKQRYFEAIAERDALAGEKT